MQLCRVFPFSYLTGEHFVSAKHADYGTWTSTQIQIPTSMIEAELPGLGLPAGSTTPLIA